MDFEFEFWLDLGEMKFEMELNSRFRVWNQDEIWNPNRLRNGIGFWI